ncbi:uncharacterized protein [Ptychodera flava]|uniref:uncharacterized protein n=1 Tax=Ptychodera flava TaxID=63121 RepID=UPI00396A9EEF
MFSFTPPTMQVQRDDEGNRWKLLSWVRSMVPHRQVKDFTKSWSDGITLCALINEIIEGSCPRYDLLNPNHRVNNCRLGLRLAQKKLGLQEPMTPEQMADARLIQEDKMYSYILSLKCASQIPQELPSDKETVVANVGKVDYKEKCTAAGSGLHVAVVGHRAKFDIMTQCNQLQDLTVRVVGPNDEDEKVKIVNERAGRGCLRDPATVLTRTREPRVSQPDKIVLDYQCIKDGQFQVSYIPLNTGPHVISIIWDREHIRNSPFQVNVASKEEAPREKKTVSFEDEQPLLDNHSATKVRRQSLLRQHNLTISESSCDLESLSPQSSLDRNDYSNIRRYTPFSAKFGRADSFSSSNRTSLVSRPSSERHSSGIRTRRKVIRRIISSSQGSTELNIASSWSTKKITAVQNGVCGKTPQQCADDSFDNPVPLSPTDDEDEPVTNILLRRKMEQYGSAQDDVLQGGRRNDARELSVEEVADKLFQQKLIEYETVAEAEILKSKGKGHRVKPVPTSLVLDSNKTSNTNIPSPSEKSLRSPLTKMKSFGKIFDTEEEHPIEDLKIGDLTIRTVCEDAERTESNIEDDEEKRQGWSVPLTPIRESSQEMVFPPPTEGAKALSLPVSQLPDSRRTNVEGVRESAQSREGETAPLLQAAGISQADTEQRRYLDQTIPSEIVEPNQDSVTRLKDSSIRLEDTNQEVDSGYHSDQIINIVGFTTLEKTAKPASSKSGGDGAQRSSLSKTIITRTAKHDKETQCSAQQIKAETGWRSRKSSKAVSKVTKCLQTDLDIDDFQQKHSDVEIGEEGRKNGQAGQAPKRSPKDRKKPMRQSTFDSGFSDENGLAANGNACQNVSNPGNGKLKTKNNFDDLDSFFSMTNYNEEMALAYMTKMLESSLKSGVGARSEDNDDYSPTDSEMSMRGTKSAKSPKLSDTGFLFNARQTGSQYNSYEIDCPTSVTFEGKPSCDANTLEETSRGPLPGPETKDSVELIDRFLTERGFTNKYDEWTELFASLDAENSHDSLSLEEGPRNSNSISDALELNNEDTTPKSSMCKAFGVGLTSGYVGTKNNFQVNTERAGNGSLTVGVVGPQSNSVTETTVVYTGDDMYEVDYEVSRPGCYVITVKWADMNIPSSPFISYVTY